MKTKRKVSRAVLCNELTNCVPANWCDPLLTGKDKALSDDHSFTPSDIENLLNAIREKMQDVAMKNV